MNLARLLSERAEAGRPVGVGLIGAGKFGSMFLAQARVTTGLSVAGIADLSAERAGAALTRTGWPESGRPRIYTNSEELIAAEDVEVIVEATGDPAVGIHHALACCRHRRHVVMVNVEADALAGPLLARKAREAGIIYSLAYGDQPSIICEMVDWARATGLSVVCAGKGTRYLPSFHASTPETVWPNFGYTEEQVATGDYNPKMFNSFIDGTKSGIEMAAVSNATGLTAAPGGLGFPPAGAVALPQVCRPRGDGGTLHHPGTVEVVSSLSRDGDLLPDHIQFGVYVVFEAPSAYTARCFGEYGVATDDSGRFAAMYRPYHLIGLEVGISVASAALRGEATGAPTGFRSDVVAVAKRDMAAGEVLDGEGGYTVWGRLMPAADSVRQGALPIGLANNVRMTSPVKTGDVIRWSDVKVDEDAEAVLVRKEMESALPASP
ncbi:MAG: Gfo/Idh/MocA family oxidoreductase [Nocardiopsaceae bacterium]|nr:Gfo/Idh/MocA family oxidoreductase [Nocardiopsaceae bacterium]